MPELSVSSERAGLRMSALGECRGRWASWPGPGPPRGVCRSGGGARPGGRRSDQLQRARLPAGGAARPRNPRPGLTSAPRLLGLPLWTRRQSRSAQRRFAPALARLGLGLPRVLAAAPPAPGPGAGGGAPWSAPRLWSWRSPSSSARLRPRLRQVSVRRSDQACPAEPPGPVA